MSETMRAMVHEEYGDPDVLHEARVPVPKVGPGEVLVKVHAVGVNPVDWKLVAGKLEPLIQTYFPAVPGWDVAGTVERVGIDVPEHEAGDEVMAYARKDVVQGGTCAEYVTVPVRCLAPKPAKATFEDAAALPLAGLTAYQVLVRLGVGAGDTVLVHGAAGGVGSVGVQVARALGASVIGTASERNHERLRELGAEPVAYGDGLVDRVRALAPRGVDVVADFVGGVREETLAVLRDGGRHASIADQSVIDAGGAWMWVRPNREDLMHLAEMVDAGQVRVDVAATYPLERLADAYRASAEGHTAGKIVVTVP